LTWLRGGGGASSPLARPLVAPLVTAIANARKIMVMTNDVCKSVTQKRAKELLEYKAAVRAGKVDYKHAVRAGKVDYKQAGQ